MAVSAIPAPASLRLLIEVVATAQPELGRAGGGTRMCSAGPWRESPVPTHGAQERWLRLVEAREVQRLLDATCPDQCLVLARLSQLLHHRPELRCVSLASQLDEGSLWGV
jgi:hypothetical protein